MRRPILLTILLGTLGPACASDAPVDLAAERATLLALHEQVLASHRTDDLDAWLALEADTMVVGNRGELEFSAKSESAGFRRSYLAATEFTTYRDLKPPVVRVSADGSMGWVLANVEIVGTYRDGPDTAAIQSVWTWIELYERRPEGWRMVGNVSTEKP